ncbi:hypothetical protein ACHAPU_004911 [Fusarium lateritium]
MSTNILDFPEEVTLMIAKRFASREIKAIRATCKKFNRVASPYLYPVLYLSCHQLDLDDFRMVANNPLLIGGVRELVIDDTTMSRCLAMEGIFYDAASYRWNWTRRDIAYPDGSDVEFLGQGAMRSEEGRLIWKRAPDKSLLDFYKSVLEGHHENRLAHTDITTLKQALPHFKSLRSLLSTFVVEPL